MDYGYQLLRHVVQQVFGNLRQAAQLTLVLFAFPFIGFLLLWASAISSGFGGGSIWGIVAVFVLSVVAYCWAAVGWHRYVLLEEMGNGLVPRWYQGFVVSYLLRAILISLIVFGVIFAVSLVLGVLLVSTQSVGVAIFFGIGLVFGVSWLGTRIGLILPAAALGERMTIGESWAATRPVSSQILLPLIVIAIAFGILGQINALIFGQSTMIQVGAMEQEQMTLSLPGQILGGVIYWVQLLMNLALLTTLYGNLIEGRALN